MNNLNIKIDLGDTDDAIAYKVTQFENIGNQYIGNFKKGYKQCANGCGRKIRITGTNDKYCKNCAREKRLETKRNWWNKQ